MNIQLYPFQQEALEIMLNTKPEEPSLIALPTGTGKGFLMGALANNINNRILMVVISTELRQQTYDKIKKFDKNADVGFIQGRLDDVNRKICIATRQSLTHRKSTRIERMLEVGEFEYVIFDEAHIAVDQIKKIIDKLNKNIKIILLTATPFNPEMNKIVKQIAYQKTILEMIEGDYLCEPRAIEVKSRTNLNGVRKIAGEFNQRDLEDTINIEERNLLIVEAYKKYAINRKHTLCFTSGISHSEELAKEFNKHGLYAKSVDSTLSDLEREDIINEFKNGKLPILCNCGVLTTGFDFPPIDCIIIARPTSSKILFCQILGRGLRKAEGKKDCLIIDIKDIIRNFDLMDISSVFDMSIKSGETVKEAQQRIKKEQEENEQRRIEEELRRQEVERKRQEQLELIAKEIKLFNKEFSKKFSEAYYHWWKVDGFTYVVSQDSDYHFTIEKIGENEFNVYKICTNKQKKNIELINTGTNILEVIDYVEHYCFHRLTSFVYRDAEWKKDKMTEKQRQYCRYGVTKWDAHKYFTSNTIKWLIKGWKKDNLEEKII